MPSPYSLIQQAQNLRKKEPPPTREAIKEENVRRADRWAAIQSSSPLDMILTDVDSVHTPALEPVAEHATNKQTSLPSNAIFFPQYFIDETGTNPFTNLDAINRRHTQALRGAVFHQVKPEEQNAPNES